MDSPSQRLSGLSPDKLALLVRGLRGRRAGGAAVRIPRLARSEGSFHPLSFAQERLWFLDQLDPGTATYNIAGAVEIAGALRPDALCASLAEVVRRHEVLRTTFEPGAEPRQRVAAAAGTDLPVIDLRAVPEARRESLAADLAGQEARRPFDLTTGPLLRTRLLQTGEKRHLLVLTVHHIVADRWSCDLLVREIAVLYAARTTNGSASLPGLPVQYADFAAWQRSQLTGEALAAPLRSWRRRLEGLPPVLDLPVDRPRRPGRSAAGAQCRIALGSALSAGLQELSRKAGATPFLLLLAAFAGLLCRISGQKDFAIAYPVSGRTRSEIEGLIGFFVNTLLLRADCAGDPVLAELVGQVREAVSEALAHQDLPFERLVQELDPERSLGQTPLAQVMLALQDQPLAVELGGLRLGLRELDTRTAKLDLLLSLGWSGGCLSGFLEYSTELFDRPTVERLLGHFEHLLGGIVTDPSRRLSELPLLGEAERRQLLEEWNATAVEYPRESRIEELFAAQAARTPAATALVAGSERLSYGELDHRSNRLAWHLRELGVGPEVLVGVCLERTAELVVALLA
ncbi:MAG TPA: condensation domain-containing protein, partial [Thermoanaerobaculia bacterium]|nr:condensation domain-containing protein [Thermoanaerobaculia bacterium]